MLQTWVSSPRSATSSCVILGKFLNVSRPVSLSIK